MFFLVAELSLTLVHVLEEEAELCCSWVCAEGRDVQVLFYRHSWELQWEHPKLTWGTRAHSELVLQLHRGKQLQPGFAGDEMSGPASPSLPSSQCRHSLHTHLLQDFAQSALQGNLWVFTFTVSQRSDDLCAVWTCFTL